MHDVRLERMWWGRPSGGKGDVVTHGSCEQHTHTHDRIVHISIHANAVALSVDHGLTYSDVVSACAGATAWGGPAEVFSPARAWTHPTTQNRDPTSHLQHQPPRAIIVYLCSSGVAWAQIWLRQCP